MHILRQPVVYYDKIYIYSPNLHQEKIQDFKDLMDSISEKVGYSVLEIDGPEKKSKTQMNIFQKTGRSLFLMM